MAGLVDHLPGGTMAQGSEQRYVGADGRILVQIFGGRVDGMVERRWGLAWCAR